jgi:hypothetical protein
MKLGCWCNPVGEYCNTHDTVIRTLDIIINDLASIVMMSDYVVVPPVVVVVVDGSIGVP